MLIALLIACVALDVARELCFKMGARESLQVPSWTVLRWSQVHASAGWSLAGAALWLVEILGWTAVLAKLPLNVAFPIMSLTYAATPLASSMVFGDVISPRRWLGIALVTAGVMIVGASGMGV